jgi:hypothetical protein
MNKLTPEQALSDVKAVRRDRADSHWLDCAIVLADALESRKDYASLDADTIDELRTENANLRDQLDVWEHAARIAAAEFKLQKVQLADLRAELDAIKADPCPDCAGSGMDPETPDPSGLCSKCSGMGETTTEPPALARFLPVLPVDVAAPPDGWVYVGMGVESGKWKVSHDIGMLCEEGWHCGISSRIGNCESSHYAIRWTAPSDIWHRFNLLAPSEGGGWIPHRPGDAAPCDCVCEVFLRGELNDRQFRTKPGEVRWSVGWRWDDEGGDNNIIGWRPALGAEVAT